jgi:hypothetical protein
MTSFGGWDVSLNMTLISTVPLRTNCPDGLDVNREKAGHFILPALTTAAPPRDDQPRPTESDF